MTKRYVESDWLDIGESISCPHCHGSGDDPNTMICVMCGGEGVLTNDDDEPVRFVMHEDSDGLDLLDLKDMMP